MIFTAIIYFFSAMMLPYIDRQRFEMPFSPFHFSRLMLRIFSYAISIFSDAIIITPWHFTRHYFFHCR